MRRQPGERPAPAPSRAKAPRRDFETAAAAAPAAAITASPTGGFGASRLSQRPFIPELIAMVRAGV